MGFFPGNFQLATPLSSQLKESDMGRTDRQTAAVDTLCPTLWGRGIIMQTFIGHTLLLVEAECKMPTVY